LNDGCPDLLGRLALPMHLACKQRFLDADFATDCVVRFETIQKTAVAFPLAIAIARLLSQNRRNFFRSLIGFSHVRLAKVRRLKLETALRLLRD